MNVKDTNIDLNGLIKSEVDTFVVQKVLNNLIDQDYSVNTIKKNKHLISQFFEYAIDNKWVLQNPTNRV